MHGKAAGMQLRADPSRPGFALGTAEPDVQDFIAQNLSAGDVFYDVGAHVGFFTLLGARLVGSTGRVYSFEPSPENLIILRHNIKLNHLQQVDIVEAAVTDRTGRADLILGMSSDNSRLGDARAITGSSIRVRTISLDDAVQRHGFSPPSLVKIDAEGAEADVLRGMAQTVERHRPIVVCEVHEYTSAREAISLVASAISREQEREGNEAGGMGPLVTEIGYRIVMLRSEDSKRGRMWGAHVVARPL